MELLGPLADFDVICVEQPLPPADLVAHALLAPKLRLPDLSRRVPVIPAACARRVAQRVVRDGLPQTGPPGRPARHRAAHAECAAAGVPVFVGGFFEAGLGRAANLALAARLSQDATGLVGDLGSPADYLAVDPCGYPPVVDGWVMVPAEPGVGRWPDPAVLDRLGVRRRWFPATYT